jgi:hypothetical protein
VSVRVPGCHRIALVREDEPPTPLIRRLGWRMRLDVGFDFSWGAYDQLVGACGLRSEVRAGNRNDNPLFCRSAPPRP